MTGLAIICTPAAVAIASDGAIFDSRGIVVRFESKLLVVPEWTTIFACRGSPLGLHYVKLRATLAGISSFDTICSSIGDLAKGAFDACAADGAAIDPNFSLIVAGWSQKAKRFEAFRIGSTARVVANPASGTNVEVPPWTPLPIEGLWCAPWPGDDAARQCGAFHLRGDIRPALRCVRLLLGAARRSVSKIDGRGEEAYWVGGFLQLSLLTKNYTATWIDQRWPDAIGQRILPDPTEFDRLLNQQHTRAWPRGLSP